MKKVISILMLILFSTILNAQNNYKNLWDEVQKFESDNLPKSALKVVNRIYSNAEKENNSPQIIKCLFFKSKFSQTLEENAQLKIINQFKKHINKNSFPTKNVLENIVANLYWQYFNQNRWKFYNRTQTQTKVDKNDFRTWDLNTLFAEIHKYYQASLQSKEKLQKIDILKFKDILHFVEISKEYRPTLYDFLAQNALDFYKTDETNITKPSYQFKIDNENLLKDAKSFSNLNLTTRDSLSLQFNALKIYQDIIAFHLKNKNLAALADADLQRMKFVTQHATFSNKNDCYLEGLKNSKSQHNNHPISGLYSSEIANIYHRQANYKNEKLRFKNKEALEICRDIIKRFPKSEGTGKCRLLENQILSKSLNMTAEEYSPIDQYQKVLVNYKNVDEVYFSVFKTNENQYDKLNNFNRTYAQNKKIAFINSLPKVTNWSAKLKNEFDYLNHTTEVVVPKLPQGNYLLIASTKNNLTEAKFSYTKIQSTNLALIQSSVNVKSVYQIVDRNTGKPIANAKVNLHNKPYRKGSYYSKLDKTFTTDKNGEFIFNSNKNFGNVKANVSYKNDNAIFDGLYVDMYYEQSRNKDFKNNEVIIFTDRSIYRPGQTVFFKGILFEKHGKKSTIFTNEKVDIKFTDANGQTVKELSLKTNEFGSFSGEFIVPNIGLTGFFNIVTKYKSDENYYGVSVEEYKRPKFKPDFKPITQSYKLNDEITVTGFAKAFSGAPVSDAKVVYRVHRKVQYPSWWYWYRPSFSSSPQEIKNGELTTDDNGNFTIKFDALPDESVDKSNNPIFTYEVTADVTDINGETRSATTEVKVGYHSLVVTISTDGVLDKSEKNHSIKIDTKNLNGEFVAANGTVNIYKLIPPNKVLRKRSWNAPDYQLISEKEFSEKFPNDSYKNEDKFVNWKKGKLVFSEDFNTAKSKEIILNKIRNWQSGKYIIELNTKDRFNQKIEEKNYFSIFSSDDKLPADNQLATIFTDKESYKIGDKAKITISSNSNDITVMLFVEKQGLVVDTHHIHLDKSSKTISVPVTKEDEGGFGISYYFVNHNSFESGTKIVNVPYPKTDLEIITKTFRDKLKPGENQTWSFTIKGAKKDIVTTELLASMYDASLDEFKEHNWNFNPIHKPTYGIYTHANARNSFNTTSLYFRNLNPDFGYQNNRISYNRFNWFGFQFGNNQKQFYGREMMVEDASVMLESSAPAALKRGIREEKELAMPMSKGEANSDKAVVAGYGKAKKKAEKKSSKGVQIRKNLQETAFFYPHLTTDKKGDVTFNFTMPEALTKWKLQLLGHTKELHSAIKTLVTVTQKELMVTPNAPRFLRHGDKITLSSKISNLSDKKLQGLAQLVLIDAVTGKEINLFSSSEAERSQSFTVDKNGNTNVSWNLSIPDTINAVQYKVVAKAGEFSDGEQNALPVLSNRMLVTETLPMWVRSNQTKTFTLDKLKSNNSTSLKHHKLTLEVTSNPAWYAVQALPYLMEYPHQCSEQTFARYYANTLASFVANSNPRIQEVFNSWKNSDALLSNLEKNQELKSLIIQETPWLRDAQSETEQKKRIALLFDLNKMKNEQQKSINKLQAMQFGNGGFPWFKGGRYPNVYITNYIASGFGHLKKLGVRKRNDKTEQMIKKAVKFLDIEIEKNYKRLLEKAEVIKAKDGVQKYEAFLAKQHVHYFELQYLYTRSFYDDIAISSSTKSAVNYYKKQSANYWNSFNLYGKGLIALFQFRNGNKSIATKILKSLRENSITSEELGMYWKENKARWYWYQAPIETQALLIEAFSEIENDTKTIDNLKIWLLKNKQVSQWKTTKATSEAVYALLLQGSDWISTTELVDIHVGDIKVDPTKMPDVKVEAGTGYFKKSWNGNEINPKMGNVTITSKGETIAWGGLYWQYFEDLDKITSAKTPLKLKKKLFKKVNSDTGKKLIEVTNTSTLQIGDLLTVRIELRSDRDTEFIHMKDMRASGVEPVNVLSQYRWQDGLGYYESTKDASTNFFFDRLPKGVYVFEYDVRVNNAGNFSNGITTIESMYAPEFKSHSEGTRINIK